MTVIFLTHGQPVMAEASRIVLDGFEVNTDVEVIKYLDRISDPRGTVMWDRVTCLIGTQRR